MGKVRWLDIKIRMGVYEVGYIKEMQAGFEADFVCGILLKPLLQNW